MTSRQRTQYAALSVVEGFIYYARTLPLGAKSRKAFNRIMDKTTAIKTAIGEPCDMDASKIYDKIHNAKKVIMAQGEEIYVMEYANAVQMMIHLIQDNIPSREVQNEWGTLEGMFFTLYTHLEEIDEISYVYDANQLGAEITLAVSK